MKMKTRMKNTHAKRIGGGGGGGEGNVTQR